MNKIGKKLSASVSVADVEFDVEALREKYQAERNKRVRADGLEQYIEVKDEFKSYVDDPYKEKTPRAGVTEDIEVLIVGGGFSGMLAAAYLHKAGVTNFRIIDRAGDFGGTWYWNRYPGAQCDVESYIYLPLLEETGYIPKEKYSHQPEIFAHAQRIGNHYGLYSKAYFQTQIRDMRWSDEEKRWNVVTDRDDHFKAKYVIACGGGLDKPRLPGIPGIHDFKGHTFHTCRWDYSYTGGDTGGNMSKLADKRIAVVGTGATGIQCVPYVARDAGQLYVFQRTPSVVNERGNRPTDPEWAKSLTSGWQQRRMANYTSLVLGGQEDEDLVDDGWTRATRQMSSIYGGVAAEEYEQADLKLQAEISDFRVMNDARGRIESIVSDKKTAEALKPWYRFFCKRPTFNDMFLPAFNNKNVTLVDTKGGGVERITEKGPVVDGVEYEVDCIIFATGFEVGTDMSRRVGYEIYGREGKTLTEHWKEGARTFQGHSSHGFPNLFHIGTIQVGFTINYNEMALRQAVHIAEIIKTAEQRQAQFIEPTAEAEADWVDTIIRGNEARQEFLTECTPSYFNNEGRPTNHGKGLADAQFAEGLIVWNRILEDWRASGKMEGLTIV